jgi:hypothetical protein
MLASTKLRRAEANDRSGVEYLEKKILLEDPWFVMRFLPTLQLFLCMTSAAVVGWMG